ncbi:MAG: ATPase [Bacteroidia bacterium]|nr:ATPase [Bacteroidia bacterium]
MKNIFLTIIAVLIVGIVSVKAQNKAKIQTDTIHVSGICDMCEKRIVDAAYIKGVKRADWDKNTGILKVVYNSQKTSISEIEKNIAATGHDAGKTKANNNDYKKLPECCAYKEVGIH